ncbi:hypothetical protein [Borreliella garinii]|uniref:hypothetical protein n=1 Tax=Borreliella garinii TaxID=29519 RepID=UPI00292FB02C|nr:hypothetical protein [Borreliella garinii]WNZ74034.1 hypothetical protein PT142_04550 [Borreliella garinii]WNZ75006.1 hypothetical protein PT137_04500 [Borreliella garinii]
METYNVLIQKQILDKKTPTALEVNLNKLEKELKLITRFYIRDIEKNLLAYYKINYPIQKCYDKIKYSYG